MSFAIKAINTVTFGAALPVIGCIWSIKKIASIHYFVSTVTDTHDAAFHHPKLYGAGAVLHFTFGNTVSVKTAAKLALLARSLSDFYEKSRDAIDAAKRLAVIKEKNAGKTLKILLKEKHAASGSLTSKIVSKTPTAVLSCVVKTQDLTLYTALFFKSIATFINAGLKLMYVMNIDDISSYKESSEVFVNIKKTYDSYLANKATLHNDLAQYKWIIEKILQKEKAPFSADDLFSTSSVIVPEEKKKQNKNEITTFVTNITKLIPTFLVQMVTSLEASPLGLPDNYDNDTFTCSARNSGHAPHRRFYKTSDPAGKEDATKGRC